ncbi:hypothetical protein PsorP6_011642 [Peronosclerospora sorghi]|uniref:Uncharacterized protein n=1 Tax=Peronosclerospora sorghi TaxID=230839 RepID=A0ACC0WKA0_9STRA|nr:hypothetical protein PsorP6_011642 [Peronosclerospora sorghi]
MNNLLAGAASDFSPLLFGDRCSTYSKPEGSRRVESSFFRGRPFTRTEVEPGTRLRLDQEDPEVDLYKLGKQSAVSVMRGECAIEYGSRSNEADVEPPKFSGWHACMEDPKCECTIPSNCRRHVRKAGVQTPAVLQNWVR